MDIKQMINKFFLEDGKLFDILYRIIIVLFIFIFAKIIIVILKKIVEKVFNKRETVGIKINEQKRKTLMELLKNIIVYIVYFLAAISSFKALGGETSTMIAIAGTASVAIGLGAQNIIKDVISGFFILFEDQFVVGDYITIDNMSGVVEVLGFRITKIRDFSGDLHIIPNGSIQVVTNKSRGNMRALVDIQIDYGEDQEKVINIINQVNEEIKNKYEYIQEGPSIYGIVNITESVVTIRIIAKTLPMKQWETEIIIRQKIKEKFDSEGIKTPYQKMVFIDGKEK